jgi:hypothetical protein
VSQAPTNMPDGDLAGTISQRDAPCHTVEKR